MNGLYGLSPSQIVRANNYQPANVASFNPNATEYMKNVLNDEFAIENYLDPKWLKEGSADNINVVTNSLHIFNSSNGYYISQPFDNPTTWVIEMKMYFSGQPAIVNYCYAGICISEDFAKRIIWHPTSRSTNYFMLEATRWTAINTWAQTYTSINIALSLPAYYRFGKAADNYYYFAVSWDGLHFFRMYNLATSNCTPTRIGVWGTASCTAGIEYFRYSPGWTDERWPLDYGVPLRG